MDRHFARPLRRDAQTSSTPTRRRLAELLSEVVVKFADRSPSGAGRDSGDCGGLPSSKVTVANQAADRSHAELLHLADRFGSRETIPRSGVNGIAAPRA